MKFATEVDADRRDHERDRRDDREEHVADQADDLGGVGQRLALAALQHDVRAGGREQAQEREEREAHRQAVEVARAASTSRVLENRAKSPKLMMTAEKYAIIVPITPKNAPTAAQPSTELLLKIEPTAGSSRSPACTQIATSSADHHDVDRRARRS